MRTLQFAYLAVLSVCSCVGQPDYVSTIGVRYYLPEGSTWTHEQIEAQEQGFYWQVAGLPAYGSLTAILKAASGMTVTVHAEKFQCKMSASGYCNGIQDGAFLEVVDLGCPGNSALTHEMAHYLQLALRGVVDYDHTETDLWGIANSQQPGGCP